MPPNSTDIARALITGLKSTLERTPPAHKGDNISVHLANQFNAVVKQISDAHPDLARHLPRPIGATLPFAEIGKADASYIDVEAYCEQLENLLRLVR